MTIQSRRDMSIRMQLETDELSRGFKKAEESAKVFERELAKIEAKQAKAQHDQAANIAHVTKLRAKHERDAALEAERAARQRAQAMDKVGKASLAMGAAVGAGVLLAANAAMKWESAWAGVEKTVDGSHQQMQILESDLRELARTLPTTHTEIAAVAEAAGQLGIQRGAIAGFTKTMIDLGETTNLTADQAATAMAQIANIMGTSADDIDRMGAALVALGNNGASTEADIVEMALRIAGAGKQVGLAESEVFAMANTLASLGINAEAGGSAISRFMMDLAVSVETGGGELQAFADVAGMTVDDFSTLFRDDAAGAVGAFTDGLGRIKESGGSAIATLEEMEITEIRLRDTLLRLAGGQGLMNASLQQGRDAWEDNTALVDEANKRYATTEAKMQIAKNAVNDLAIDLGTTLLPALASVVSGVTSFASFISDLPGPLKAAASVLAVVTSGVMLTGGAALIAVPKIAAFKVSLDALAASGPRAAAGIGLVSKAAGAAGMLGIFAAAAAAGYALGKVLESVFEDSAPAVDELTVSLLDFTNKGKISGEAAAWLGEDFGRLGKQIETANAHKLDIFDGRGAMEINSARDILGKLDDTLATMVQNGHADEAAALLEKMRAAAKAQGHDVAELDKHMDDYQATVTATAAEQETAAGSAYALATGLSGVDANAVNAYASLGDYAASLNMSEDATKDLMKQVEQWADSLADFVQPLGAYTDLLSEKEAAERKSAEEQAKTTESQKDSWEDYADAVSVSVQEYLGELEKQVEAQEKHADNMLLLAGRVSQETLDELARMGPEGAPLVAELVHASAEELDKLDDLFARRTKDATGAMAGQLYLANVLLPQIASKIGEDTAFALARKLADGTTTVAQIAQDYAWALEGGLAPLLKSLGAPMVHSLVRQENAQARRPRGFADGGFEDHTAQIAPAGAWRLWAEPETGGEAYIPLAPSKRGRSVSIWEETGRRLGVFAAGGFHTPGDVPRPPSTRPFGPPISSAADAAMATAYGEAADFVQRFGLQPGAGVEAMMTALRARFPGLPLHSGLRPGAITATGNRSYHAQGRAVDIPARMDVFDWIAATYGPRTAELIFSPAGGRQINNGRPHVYGEPTRSMHFDHVHWAMARGGILNPHVRDRGGPLLPGYTLNATGAPEMVLPMAAGGMTWTGPTTGGSGSLSQVAASMGSVPDLQALLDAWDRHLEQLKQAERRHELLVAVQNKEAGAIEALREFDVAAYRDAEREAVEAQIDAIEALAQAEEDAARAAQEDYERRVSINNNLFELGKISTEDHLGNLDRRMAREEEYSDAWMSLWRQREAVLKDVADAEKRAIDEAQDAADKAEAHLNRLLDERQAVQRRMADSSARYAADQRRIDDRRRDDAARFTEQQRALQQREVDLAADHFARLADARRRFVETEAGLVAARRDALARSTAADQLTEFRRGLPAGWLVSNVQQQVEDLAEWMRQLDLARQMGVSESVIAALGLDEGPQALYQVKALTSATAAEIDALNDAVEARTRKAGQQATREQTRNLGQLGQSLAQAQRQYADSVAEIQADYRDGQAQLAADLLELQAEYTQAQQALTDELRELQAEFLAEQEELSGELARIGTDQGRSLADAIAEGIRSGIPAIEAAAKAAQAAAAGVAAPAAPAAKPAGSKPAAAFGTTGQIAALRASLGLPPDPVSDRVWVERLATGQATIGDARTRMLEKVRTGTYDSGGPLLPGYTLAYNGTGATEHVFTAQQMAAMGGGERTVQFMPHATVVVQDRVDMDVLMRQAEFMVSTGTL